MDRQHALVVVVGDLHTNSTVALSRPRVPLDDGGEELEEKSPIV